VTPLETALAYAARGWAVFPCIDKTRPLVAWSTAATADESRIRQWWRRWPRAQIGLITGEHFVVLDVDRKDDGPSGLDTLADLGFPFWFEAPTVHTPSGGLHAYFRPPATPIRNTVGKRGRGVGDKLDWRGLGGYVCAPSPGSGYWWDPYCGIDMPLAEVPEGLLPRAPERIVPGRPVRPASGLSRYAEAALRRACGAIVGATAGEQEATLHKESFAIGTLAASGAVPPGFAKSELLFAASQLRDYRPRNPKRAWRPWRAEELQQKVERSFARGMGHPR
jgi:hypothetical protein